MRRNCKSRLGGTITKICIEAHLGLKPPLLLRRRFYQHPPLSTGRVQGEPTGGAALTVHALLTQSPKWLPSIFGGLLEAPVLCRHGGATGFLLRFYSHYHYLLVHYLI